MTRNLKVVDDVAIKTRHKATCHCGRVELAIHLPNGLKDLRRCDCSLCRRRGAVTAAVPLSDLTILKGETYLKLYQFNTNTAKHFFCGHCGIYTHHQKRSNPSEYGFNVGCLEGINPLKIDDVPTTDGVNHSADRTGSS